MQPNAAESQLLWLNIANIAIALVVAAILVVAAGALVIELLPRIRRRQAAASLPVSAPHSLFYP